MAATVQRPADAPIALPREHRNVLDVTGRSRPSPAHLHHRPAPAPRLSSTTSPTPSNARHHHDAEAEATLGTTVRTGCARSDFHAMRDHETSSRYQSAPSRHHQTPPGGALGECGIVRDGPTTAVPHVAIHAVRVVRRCGLRFDRSSFTGRLISEQETHGRERAAIAKPASLHHPTTGDGR